MLFHLCHHSFETLLKITSIPGSSQQRAHVERINGGLRQDRWRLALGDLTCETFGDGGFANTWIPDQKRVVFAPAAEHLNAALDFEITPNQRVHIALQRFCIQIDTVFFQRAVFFCGFSSLTIE